MALQFQLSLRYMAHVVTNIEALTLTEKNSVASAPYLRTKMDYFNLLAHTPHLMSKPADGISGLACGTLHRPEGHRYRTVSAQPGIDLRS